MYVPLIYIPVLFPRYVETNQAVSSAHPKDQSPYLAHPDLPQPLLYLSLEPFPHSVK